MTAKELIQSEAELWHEATHHRFLDGVREGTLPPEAFARWLAQDYHFAVALIRAEARYLAAAVWPTGSRDAVRSRKSV